MHPTFVCIAEYPFQKLLFDSRQDVEDHRIIRELPTSQHYSFVGIYPRHMRRASCNKRSSTATASSSSARSPTRSAQSVGRGSSLTSGASLSGCRGCDVTSNSCVLWRRPTTPWDDELREGALRDHFEAVGAPSANTWRARSDMRSSCRSSRAEPAGGRALFRRGRPMGDQGHWPGHAPWCTPLLITWSTHPTPPRSSSSKVRRGAGAQLPRPRPRGPAGVPGNSRPGGSGAANAS